MKLRDLEPVFPRINDTELVEEPDCLCGHSIDDHDEDLECCVEECPCFAYDADEDE